MRFWLAALVNVTLANATWPPGAICLLVAGVYGDTTVATSGTCRTLANSCSARARTAGSVTLPCDTATTSWSVSPEVRGVERCNSRMASKLPVWGSLKLSVYALPAAEWIPTSATSPTIQAITVSSRCLKHHVASFLISQSTSESMCAPQPRLDPAYA